MCRPAGAAQAVPAPYYIHGGGMMAGTNRRHMANMLNLAEAVSAAVVSVEYRLAPETRHPGPVEDAYAGPMWLAGNAESSA
jgi:acetyl esterase/lipase